MRRAHIGDQFRRAGVLDPALVDARALTPHVTFVNTRYADGRPLNAQALIGDARAVEFGAGRLAEVHLSRREIDPGTKAYYCEEKLALP